MARLIRSTRALAAALRAPARQMSTKEVGDKHNPFGGLGSGYYSDNTKGCYDVVDNATPMMLEACRAVLDARKGRGAAAKGEPFVISDYGTADAGTSMPMMHELVELIRSVEPQTPVVLQYEDQPQNDWTSVFRRVQGEIESRGGVGEGAKKTGSAMGIMDRFPLVTAVGTGVSFYKTCFPRSSVDLMFCSTAFHWLRTVPAQMPTVLHSAMAQEGTPEHAAYREAAHADWQEILSKRAEELKPGGRFGTVSFAKNDQGHFLGKSSHVGQSMHDRFRHHWDNMASEGVITKEEFLATNFPNQYRSMEETLRPFGGEAGPATETSASVISASDGGLKAKSGFQDLHVIAASYGEVRCPYHVRWVSEKAARKSAGMDEKQAARDHAVRFVPTTRTWSNSTFESGCDKKRSPEERAALAEEMFQRYTNEIAADPDNHAMDYQHVYIMFEKRA